MVPVCINPPFEEWEALAERFRGDGGEDGDIRARVEQILRMVRRGGDRALREIVAEIEGRKVEDFAVSEAEFAAAEAAVSASLRDAISLAAGNIRRFHEAQRGADIDIETTPGVRCVQRAVPIRRVGLYVPGGSAPLVSTVLMLAIPARVAGCSEVVMCTPAGADGAVAPAVLYAARVCGVDRVLKIGGAQAIAAMAYGTESVGRVDKIFGPGNRYVTLAKQLVSAADCAVDMPAGPSEVLVLADGTGGAAGQEAASARASDGASAAFAPADPAADSRPGSGSGAGSGADLAAGSDGASAVGSGADLAAGSNGTSAAFAAADPAAFAAADMLSQAEHGGDSQALLVCLDAGFADAVNREIERRLATLSRRETAAKALKNSRIIVLPGRQEAIRFANLYAAEHLIVQMADPWDVAREITAAGSVFVGPWSPESAGDYASGTNHTLPTAGWARSHSGVNLDSFMRRITFQELSRTGLATLAPAIEALAGAEGLDAHAAAVAVRLGGTAEVSMRLGGAAEVSGDAVVEPGNAVGEPGGTEI